MLLHLALYNAHSKYICKIRYYFMIFGSLSENNDGLSLDNLTVSSSESIIHRANRLSSDISGNSIGRY